MRRFYLVWALVVFCSCFSVLILATQAPAPAKPAAAVLPALDELEQAWVKNVILAQQLANSQCQALDSVKQFTAIRTDVTAKVEAKRPGFTMDWTTGLLAVKK